MSDFVHLHLHSEYSLLDGACRISEIPEIAKEMGHKAVAITDHGSMYGVVAFYKSCVDAGIKPIIGCEVYVAPRSRFDKTHEKDASNNHLVLLVKNEIGYRNLIYMISRAYIDGFYSKPRIDMELLSQHTEGLIALSACLAGYIPRCITSGDYNEAERNAIKMRDMFGEGNFYLEIQDHRIPEQRTVIDGLAEISEKHNIGLAATNDVHYLRRKDAETQAIMLCIQTNNVITDGRPIGFETDEFYYKSTEEMEALFGKYKGAIENTSKIADMCDFKFTFGKIYLPRYTPENGLKPDEYLKNLSWSGFESRLARDHIVFDEIHTESEYRNRVEYELEVIIKMGYSEYFLIVWDFVNYSKSKGIPVGPGRGSGAGSLVAYLLGITDIDSIKFDLLFERFLNPERISMPDFDIDFCYDRRDEAIEYVKNKYGEDHTAQIVTFGTMAARAAVRDVGRALGMSYSDVDVVAKLIPQELGITLKKALERKELNTVYEADEKTRKLIDTAAALEGMPRHASTHAAGVVITDEPLCSYVPLSMNNGVIVTQYNMDTIAEFGLLKFDFLALRYLTICSNAEKQILETEPDFDISKIPIDDKASFDLISSGHTSGIFQLESSGMRQMLMNLKPESIHDIIAAIALYRPGPMDSIPRYLECRHDKSKIKYKIHALAPILDITYGCIVYQEQVMQIFREIAGYSYGQADIVRRAMSKKKAAVMEMERADFISGAEKNGFSAADANDLFEEMADFAKYAFNKSHAAAYAVITYRTAYLKTHYTKQYLAALMTSVLGVAAKVAEYTNECVRYSIKILPPDINESYTDFHVNGNDIRFGLLALKNVGKHFIQNIITERLSGRYKNFEDFLSRMSAYDINKRQVEALIKSGAFDNLDGIRRSQLLRSYEKLMEYGSAKSKKNIDGQLDMFQMLDTDANDTAISLPSFEYPDVPEFTMREKLMLEKESSGLYFSGHMLDDYTSHLSVIQTDKISDIMMMNEDIFDSDALAEGKADDIPEYVDRQKVTIAGIITKRTNKSTKSGESMAFLTVEDRSSEIEVIVFAKNLMEYTQILTYDSAVIIKGNITVKDEDAPKIMFSSASQLIENSKFQAPAKNSHNSETKPELPSSNNQQLQKNNSPAGTNALTPESKIFLKIDRQGSTQFERVMALIEIFDGEIPIILFDSEAKKYIKVSGLSASGSGFLTNELKNLLGSDNVVVK